MRTFQEASKLSEPVGDEPIDRFTLSYMAGLARDRIHQVILHAFEESGLTKAQLARRLGMDKSRLSRILNTSSNITAETMGEVLFAIDGSCPAVSRNWPLKEQPRNLREPEWFSDCLDGARIRTKTFTAISTEHVISTNVQIIRKREEYNEVHEHA